ncbi:acyl carrier protein [Streptomyces sp. NPDC058045]|uniref:acyl carrier protein n=1 Tax=Streptomyces sp. NPDC058045 TaxID=3346311 RepID=UPI0036E458FA
MNGTPGRPGPSLAPEVITERVLAFLTESLRTAVGPDDDYFEYFEQGLADSLFSLELVTFVEHSFDLTIEVEDLDLDSFRTAHRVTEFVLRKTGAAADLGEAHGRGA